MIQEPIGMGGSGNAIEPDKSAQFTPPLNQSGDASEAELSTMDAIASSIDDIGANVQSMSSIMTALSAGIGSITDTTLMQNVDSIKLSLSTISTGFADLLNSFGLSQEAISAEGEQVEALQNPIFAVSEQLTSIDTKFDGIITLLANINENLDLQRQAYLDSRSEMLKASQEAASKQAHAEISDTTNSLDTMYKLVETFVDKTKTTKFAENKDVWGEGFKDLAGGLDILVTSAKALDEYKEVLHDVAKTSESVAMTFEGVAKSAIAITLSMAGIFAMFSILDNATIIKATIGFPVMATAIAGGLYVIGLALQEVDPVAIKQFAISSVILTSSLLLWQFIPADSLVKAGIALTGFSVVLGATMYVLSKVLDKKKVADIGNNMLKFSASVAILGASVLLLSYAFENVDWPAIGKGAAVMAGATVVLAGAILIMSFAKNSVKDFGWSMLAIVGSVALLGLTLPWFQEQIQGVKLETYGIAAACIGVLAVAAIVVGQSKEHVQKGAVAVLILTTAIALVPLAIRQYDDITWEQMAKPGAALLALTGAVVAVGHFAKHAVGGAVATLIMAGSVAALAYIIPKFDDVSWESIGKVGACIAGLVAAMYLAGASVSMSLPGAAALVVASASLLVLAKALNAWPHSVTWEQYAEMAKGIGILGAAVAGIGLLSVPIMLGSAAGATLGYALSSLAKGLSSVASVDMKKAEKPANDVIDWATRTSKKIASGFSAKELIKARFAMKPIYELGNALQSVTAAVVDMANGTYNEYALDADGNKKVIAVHHIDDTMYTKFGDALESLLNGIHEPLVKFGQGGGLFGLIASDTEKGAGALASVSTIIEPMLKLAKESDSLANASYTAFGTALGGLMSSIEEPLNKLGTTSWYEIKSDGQRGAQAIKDIMSIVESVMQVAENKDKLADLTVFDNFGTAITKLSPGLQKITEENQKLKSGNVVKTLNAFNDVASNFGEGGNAELLRDTAVALSELGTIDLSALQKVKDVATKELYQRLINIETKLGIICTNTENTTDAIMPAIKVDPATGKPDIQLNEGDTVDMATIGYMLKRIMTAVEIRR